MISRLTTLAATFAVIATASIAYAATVRAAEPVGAKTVRVVQLQPVVVVAKRLQ